MLTALFTKESLAIRSGKNTDLQPNKCIKERRVLRIVRILPSCNLAKESLVLWIVYIELRLRINIFEFRINVGSTVQGELAALAV